MIIGTEVLLGIDGTSTSPWERQQWGWRGERLWARLSGLPTGLTEGLVGETGKGWGRFSAFFERLCLRGRCLERCRLSLSPCPPPEHAKPKLSEHQQCIEKRVVSHVVSLRW
jgi:hypothetical protein